MVSPAAPLGASEEKTLIIDKTTRRLARVPPTPSRVPFRLATPRRTRVWPDTPTRVCQTGELVEGRSVRIGELEGGSEGDMGRAGGSLAEIWAARSRFLRDGFARTRDEAKQKESSGESNWREPDLVALYRQIPLEKEASKTSPKFA